MTRQLTVFASRYQTGVAEDPRTAYMRLVLWAAAAKATAHFYGLNPSDDDFVREQLLLAQEIVANIKLNYYYFMIFLN